MRRTSFAVPIIGDGGGGGESGGASALNADGSLAYAIDTKTIADAVDEEFASGLGAWTITGGVEAAVQLLGAPSSRYDITTKPGRLLLQAGNTGGDIKLRKPFTLADGQSVVAKLHMAPNYAGTRIADEYSFGLWMNGSTTDISYLNPRVGAYSYMNNTDGFVFYGWAGTAGKVMPGSAAQLATFFARISRSGTTYYASISIDGEVWAHLTAATMATAPTQLWLHFVSQRVGAPYPIGEVEWVRLGSNAVRPWT